MRRLGVALMVAATLGSCAPAVYGRGPGGQDIPFVWNAPVQDIPLEQAGEATPPEQYVTLPGCPRAAVQLRYVRQYGVEATRAACLSALEQGQRNYRATSTALSVAFLPLVPLVVAFIYLLVRLLSFGA